MTLPHTHADRSWHATETAEAIDVLDSGLQGLSTPESARRIRQYGPNVLEDLRPPSAALVFARQFRSPLIAILLAAATVTLVFREWIDAGVIAFVLLLNASIGFVQERKADAAVRALMEMAVPRARVLRDGREVEVDGRDLVPGDLVLLESGARIPADMRLIRAQALLVDESMLTGESEPVVKHTRALASNLPLGDRGSVAHAGSMVTSGRGAGLVFATGPHTVLGGIAELLRSEPQAATPLQQRMTRLSRLIMFAVLSSCALVFVLGLATGGQVRELLMAAVALAVAAVPEGLPIVLTIALALGVTRMARRNAIVRRLPAVETLGSATVIGSDKTGTLTENRMTVRRIWAAGQVRLPVSVSARSGFGAGVSSPLAQDAATLTLLTGVLTNEAVMQTTTDGVEAQGDPTEIALLLAAAEAGLAPEPQRDAYACIADLPFEPSRRFSAAIRAWNGTEVLFAKGAPERVVDMCDSVLADGAEAPLDVAEANAAARSMAADGLRVLALAVSRGRRSGDPPLDLEEPCGLVLVGLVGLMDPPRKGVREAVAACHSAGVRVVMITGDHALTAGSIATELGITSNSRRTVTGSDLEGMDEDELRSAVSGTDVFARVSPEDKLRIVRALQAHGEVVAVTGDGVNDAPALKSASIGVAMGEGGTDVAREAAEIVLTDDNFVSIVGAIEQGRITFDNVRRATFFLVSTSMATIVALIVTVAAGWPLLMVPAQLLWLNLVTSGLQDVALAFERGDRNVLRKSPRSAREGIMSPLLWQRAAGTSIVRAGGTLALFYWVLEDTGSIATAQTVALTTMVLFSAFQAGNARSEYRSVFTVSLRDNPFLVWATIGTLALHMGALYFPPTQLVLRVEPLPLHYWPIMIAVAAAVLVVVEAEKAVRRRVTHDADSPPDGPSGPGSGRGA
ncbi:HAD-IC family P-type ATPase [Lipingzhangella sp. LS1_29]|uniref:HAD-IC family P-type ATPase n=1 Tax=Lipingzhangella rawalii TaxID=2055835 RepID=A0ABU2HAM1_9ACTN|nr:HAD-IC family P-type ATPase [Lipingzhangella rawalii]MDS1272363.1 HAD-IC family P-type ATPase [Lipingzhangella rawalii]